MTPWEIQKKSMAKSRNTLIEKLGGKCEFCSEADPAKLEFDHIKGRDYNPNTLSSTSRMARYKREAEQGKLRLLCAPCNLKARKRHEDGTYCRTEHEPGPKTPDLTAKELAEYTR